jgi:NAD(P)-dependent dehydrogenase (short-subunit alcohol dehydrogenase family)
VLLEDRVCVVAGVGPGLGRKVSLALADHGADVVLAARREEVLRNVAQEVEAAGRRALVLPTDVTDAAQCEALAATTVREFGRVDVLVNNVFAADVYKTFRRVELDDWRRLVDVNLFGPLQVTKAFIPHMQEHQSRHVAQRTSIVFVNSMAVRKPRPQEGGYAVAKAGLLSAASVLAKELGRHRIRVNSVLPGWMWGPQVEQYVDFLASHRAVDRSQIIDEITKDIALGVIPTDEQVAGCVIFLASDLSAAVTGHALDANGGEVCV